MAKIEANTDCHDFVIDCILGKEAAKVFKEEAELPPDHPFPAENELIVNLYPTYGSFKQER